jgi:HEAT repeat protein
VKIDAKFIGLISAILLGLSLVSSSILAQTTEELIANLRSPIVKTRREAAQKLGQRRERAAVEPLERVVRQDENTEVRQAAVEALGLIKDDSSVPTILAALEDTTKEVRASAVKSLVSFSVEHNIDFITVQRTGLNWLNPFLDTYEGTIIEPYTQVDQRIIDKLVHAALRDRDREVKIAAIRALGVLRATSTIPSLGDLMFASSFLRVEILRTFIKFGDPSAVQYITPFFNDSDSDVRHEALTAAGILRSDEAVPELIKVYQANRDEKTSKLALEALALIGDPQGKDIFLANMRQSDVERRRYAYEGLARVGEKKYVERVSRDRLSERSDAVKLAQAFALYKLGRREYIEAIVQDLDSGRKDQATGYLLEVRPEDLYPYLSRSTVLGRKRIVEALGHIGTEETIAKLTPLLKNPDPDLVNAANLAIERIKRRHADTSDQRKRPRRAQER